MNPSGRGTNQRYCEAHASGTLLCPFCRLHVRFFEVLLWGLNTQIHLAVDAQGLPVRVLVTQGPTADCTQAAKLIKGLSAEHLLADKGYDTDAILEQAKAQGMNAVIPPKKNRTTQRPYDEDLYKLRHLVENTFLHLKRWRGIATRYAKNTASFLAAVHIRCIAL